MIKSAKKTEKCPPSVERRARYTLMPSPPKRMDMLWRRLINEVCVILSDRCGDDPATLVGANAYLAHALGDWRAYQMFDCIVAFGVDADEIEESNGYIISEAGKPPDFILEIATKRTRVRDYPMNDYTVKRRVYRDMGAGEYWRFDSSGGSFHGAPLAGDVLADGEYRPLEIRRAQDGTFRGYSPALALYLVWDEGRLRFYDPAVRDFLPDLSESKRQTAAAERRADMLARRADMSERRADRADRRANAERAERIMSERRAAASERRADEADRRADESERRAAEAEAELERLRGLLGGL